MKKKSNHIFKKIFARDASPKIIFGLIAILLLSLLIFLGAYPYISPRINQSLKQIYQFAPLPVAKIKTTTINSRQLYQNLTAVKHFYLSFNGEKKGTRIDFSTPEGKVRLAIKEKEILNKMIEDVIIRALAEERGIKVSPVEVDRAIEESLQKAGSDYQRLALSLRQRYNWTVADFKNKVVKNQLYRKKLFQWYSQKVKKTASYESVQAVREKIKKEPDKFTQIAKEHQSELNSHNPEKIGWINEQSVIPEVGKVLVKLQPNEISPVIVSPLGLHIVQLLDKREDEKGEREFLFQHLFIPTPGFVQWLQAQKRHFPVKILFREYQWDKSKGEAIFRSEKMRELEKIIRLKSEGDPSL